MKSLSFRHVYNLEMQDKRIRELLSPFLLPGNMLSDIQIASLRAHLEILLRWNGRMNLTAIHDPEEIVTRHFGESLFAAQQVFADATKGCTVIDIGSGAGFPGLPMKIWSPNLHLTLIEANHKKSTFLRECIRALKLENVEVFAGRAESFSEKADVVAMRAVDGFETAARAAIRLVNPAGRIALLTTLAGQSLFPESAIQWQNPIPVPNSNQRIILVGNVPRGDWNQNSN